MGLLHSFYTRRESRKVGRGKRFHSFFLPSCTVDPLRPVPVSPASLLLDGLRRLRQAFHLQPLRGLQEGRQLVLGDVHLRRHTILVVGGGKDPRRTELSSTSEANHILPFIKVITE